MVQLVTRHHSKTISYCCRSMKTMWDHHVSIDSMASHIERVVQQISSFAHFYVPACMHTKKSLMPELTLISNHSADASLIMGCLHSSFQNHLHHLDSPRLNDRSYMRCLPPWLRGYVTHRWAGTSKHHYYDFVPSLKALCFWMSVPASTSSHRQKELVFG